MKRLFTILFSAVVLISAAFFVSCNADSEPTNGNATQETDSTDSNSGGISKTETKGKIILHAQYPYIYVWKSGSQFDNTQSEMVAEENGWYRFEIESSSAMVIFKPNADDWNGQTDDLHATTGEWWYNDGKLSESKPSGGQEFVTIPSAPKNVTTEATSSSCIKISWDAVDGADDYVVYYRLSLGVGNESYERNGTETTKTTTDTSVSITDLEYKMYLFWVTAKNSAGESYESDIKFDYPYPTSGSSGSSSESGSSGTTTTLSAPTGLIATATSSSSVELSWNSVDEATMYYVYQSEDYSSSTASVVSSTASTSMIISGLKENTTYYFWVKALEDTTMSDYSSYAYATTKAASSSSGGGSLTTTNDLLSDIIPSTAFTAPVINKNKTVLTDGKNGFYIPLSNEMNAEYYILYRSTTSKTDKSTYKKIKTVSRSSNIAFEDFDIDFTKNKTYYYVIVATSSKNDTHGTISANALSIVLGNTRIKYTITTDNSKKTIKRYVSVDGSDTIAGYTFPQGGNKYNYDPLEPGYHSIEFCKTLNGSYMQIVSNYNFLPGCEYSINLDSGNISSSSPTLSSNSISTFTAP